MGKGLRTQGAWSWAGMGGLIPGGPIYRVGHCQGLGFREGAVTGGLLAAGVGGHHRSPGCMEGAIAGVLVAEVLATAGRGRRGAWCWNDRRKLGMWGRSWAGAWAR